MVVKSAYKSMSYGGAIAATDVVDEATGEPLGTSRAKNVGLTWLGERLGEEQIPGMQYSQWISGLGVV